MHDDVSITGKKLVKKMLTNDDIKRMSVIEDRYPFSKLPVCRHCESLAYWHTNGTALCPMCGTVTVNPITFSEYYVKGYDLDGVVVRNKESILKDRELMKGLEAKTNEEQRTEIDQKINSVRQSEEDGSD